MNKDPFFSICIPENDYESSSLNVIPTVVHTAAPYSEHVIKWTKDHPLYNIIGELERPISIKLQLYEQALFCYYDAFLRSVEPNNYKDVLTQTCCIEEMQEELNELERLKVWELVPRPNKVMVITLKWIYKVKLDELRGILKNKARLVARGYRQEEGIDFKESFDPVNTGTVSVPYHFSSTHTHPYSKGTMNPTLFIRRQGKDILLISQSPRGIFINQSKYALEPLKKYGMESSDPVDTPMVEKSKLDEAPQRKGVDPTHYHEMVGTLIYLITSRLDLTFVDTLVSKGLFYTLTAYADADHAGFQDTRRSTSGSMKLLGDRLVGWSSKRQKALRYPVWKLNILPCLAVVLKFYG
nr:hypothetical protein [Tanacetum cinerariifolium]